jgi:hypothetical protein
MAHSSSIGPGRDLSGTFVKGATPTRVEAVAEWSI